MRTASRALLVAVAAALILGACAAVDPAQPLPTPEVPTAPSPTPAAPATTQPEPAPTPPLEVGDVPLNIMEALVDETAALAQVSLLDVRVQRAEAVTWRDASLGCPEPDMGYAQFLVDGYWVVLEAGGQLYDWRMSEDGPPRLCPEGQGEPPLEDLPD